MRKSNTSERLQQIMKERDLRQADIIRLAEPYCKEFGVKLGRNDLSQYVSNKVEPRQTKLYILSLALNVNEAWLMGYDVPIERVPDEERNLSTYDNIFPITTRKLPMLGEIACGQPIFATEERESYVVAGIDIEADFCLRAKGDSMINARILDGDIIFVRKQDTVENGEIAAVIIDDEATLKRVYFYPDKQQVSLVAENPAYPPLIYTDTELSNVHILGKVVAFQSDVR